MPVPYYYDSKIHYSVTTSKGVYTLESSALPLNQWHRIAGRLYNNQLELSINGVAQTPIVIDGSLPLTITGSIEQPILTLGQGYSGLIADFALYDPHSEPLLVFPSNDDIEQDIVYDPQGLAHITLKSQGLLDSYAQRAIALKADEQIIGAVMLVSHKRLSNALMMISSLTDAPSGSDIGLELQYRLQHNQAPLLLAKNLIGHTHNTEQYTRKEAMIVLLSALYSLPDSHKIQAYIQPMQQIIDQSNNIHFIHSAIDSIGANIQQALSGEASALAKSQLLIKALAEIKTDSPGMVDYILNSINGRQAFETWQQFFSLPARGWLGYRPPIPALDSLCTDTGPLFKSQVSGIDIPLIPCRVTGEVGNALLQVILDDSPSLIKTPHMLPPLLKDSMDTLPFLDARSKRDFFYTIAKGAVVQNVLEQSDSLSFVSEAHAVPPIMLAAGAVARIMARASVKMAANAAKNIKSFLLGHSNSRENPMKVLSSMVYLMSRTPAVDEDEEGWLGCTDCKLIAGGDIDVAKKVKSLFTLFFKNLSWRGHFNEFTAYTPELECKIWDNTHGKLFEIIMLAYFHARFEYKQKDNMFEISDIQQRNKVWLVEKDDKTGKKKRYTYFYRDSDIVLKSTTSGGLPIMVELKSAQARKAKKNFEPSKFTKKYPLWSVNKGKGYSIHRQLVLDNIAKTEVTLPDPDETYQVSSDYFWLWHDWKEPDKKRESSRDPGVSIWDQKNVKLNGQKKSWPNAGEALRVKLSALSMKKNAKARKIIQTTLNTDKDEFDHLLADAVGDFGYKHFAQLNWYKEFVDILQKKIAPELDYEAQQNLEAFKTMQEEAIDDLEEQKRLLKSWKDNLTPDSLKNSEVLSALDVLYDRTNELVDAIDKFETDIYQASMEFIIPDEHLTVPCS